jgi:hypothetical protein
MSIGKKIGSQEVCKLCLSNCTLQKSHVFPEFLYKQIYDNKHRVIEFSDFDKYHNGTKKRYIQKGLYERLLCSDCEQLLNERYEKYFYNLWFKQHSLPEKFTIDDIVHISGIDYTKQPPAKAGGFELRTESPDTRRLNDAS